MPTPDAAPSESKIKRFAALALLTVLGVIWVWGVTVSVWDATHGRAIWREWVYIATVPVFVVMQIRHTRERRRRPNGPDRD